MSRQGKIAIGFSALVALAVASVTAILWLGATNRTAYRNMHDIEDLSEAVPEVDRKVTALVASYNADIPWIRSSLENVSTAQETQRQELSKKMDDLVKAVHNRQP